VCCHSVFRVVKNANDHRVFCMADTLETEMYVKQILQENLIKHWLTNVQKCRHWCSRFQGCAAELECLLSLCTMRLSTVTCLLDIWLSIESASHWLRSSSSLWFSWLEFVPREILDLLFRMGQFLLLLIFRFYAEFYWTINVLGTS